MRSTYSSLIILGMCLLWTSCSKRFVNPIEDVYSGLIDISDPNQVLKSSRTLRIFYASRNRLVDIKNDISADKPKQSKTYNDSLRLVTVQERSAVSASVTSVANRLSSTGVEVANIICGVPPDFKICPCEFGDGFYIFMTSEGMSPAIDGPEITDNGGFSLFPTLAIQTNGQEQELPSFIRVTNGTRYKYYVLNAKSYPLSSSGASLVIYAQDGSNSSPVASRFGITYNPNLGRHESLKLSPQ